MRPLRVYGWTGTDYRLRTTHNQSRCIVAAHSKAEAARLAGYDRPSQMFNLCETGNDREIAEAVQESGVVIVRPIGDHQWTGPVFRDRKML